MAIKTSFARWVIGTGISAALLVSVSAFAAVPATLTQQGRILDTTGTPVASKVNIVFTVYDAAKAGAVLWTEKQSITLDDGYFSAELGSVTPIPATVFDGTVRYLGVTVGSDSEMSPRQAITSVPYAMKAGVADVASSAAFTSLSGIPAPCAAGMYLKGYDATGAAQCGTLPALSCQARYGESTASVTTAEAGCPTGEIMTGGGCYSNQPLSASYPNVCTASGSTASSVTPPAGGIAPAVIPPIIIFRFA